MLAHVTLIFLFLISSKTEGGKSISRHLKCIPCRVGIHSSFFEDFILDLRSCYLQSRLYIRFTC
jgi:hypothetical protein